MSGRPKRKATENVKYSFEKRQNTKMVNYNQWNGNKNLAMLKYVKKIPHTILYKFIQTIDSAHDIVERESAKMKDSKNWQNLKQLVYHDNASDFVKRLFTTETIIFSDYELLKRLLGLKPFQSGQDFEYIKETLFKHVQLIANSRGITYNRNNNMIRNRMYSKKIKKITNYKSGHVHTRNNLLAFFAEPTIRYIIYDSAKYTKGKVGQHGSITRPGSQRHLDFLNRNVVTPAQIFDSNNTEMSSIFTFMFFVDQNARQNGNKMKHFQGQFDQLYGYFQYFITIPKNIYNRAQIKNGVGIISNCNIQIINEINFECEYFPFYKTNNNLYRPFATSTTKPNLFLKRVSIFSKNNRFLFSPVDMSLKVQELRGPSIHEIVEFTMDAARKVTRQTEDVKRNLKNTIIKIGLDWKRSQDSFQFYYARQLQNKLNDSVFYIHSIDKLAIVLGFFHGVSMIFETQGEYEIHQNLNDEIKAKRNNERALTEVTNHNNNKMTNNEITSSRKTPLKFTLGSGSLKNVKKPTNSRK